MSDSGQIIKRLREQRNLKASDVERISREIWERKNNKDYYIGHATLADIEAGSIPGIYKIESLAVIFRLPLREILLVFGIDSRETDQLAIEPPRTTVLEPGGLLETEISFRLNFDSRVNPRDINILPPKPEEWGIAPPALIKRLQPKRFTYAILGIDDDSMAEIIPPGSLIEIDREQNVIRQDLSWRTLRERPIHLIWHDEGYSCGWCQIDRHELTVSPHPASTRRVRHLQARDVTVIGRVIHAWCSLQLPPFSAS
jgi:transcriptional regulator with XRE-family HTH domain